MSRKGVFTTLIHYPYTVYNLRLVNELTIYKFACAKTHTSIAIRNGVVKKVFERQSISYGTKDSYISVGEDIHIVHKGMYISIPGRINNTHLTIGYCSTAMQYHIIYCLLKDRKVTFEIDSTLYVTDLTEIEPYSLWNIISAKLNLS